MVAAYGSRSGLRVTGGEAGGSAPRPNASFRGRHDGATPSDAKNPGRRLWSSRLHLSSEFASASSGYRSFGKQAARENLASEADLRATSGPGTHTGLWGSCKRDPATTRAPSGNSAACTAGRSFRRGRTVKRKAQVLFLHPPFAEPHPGTWTPCICATPLGALCSNDSDEIDSRISRVERHIHKNAMHPSHACNQRITTPAARLGPASQVLSPQTGCPARLCFCPVETTPSKGR